ncbi:MAG: hypothetical protein U1E58_06590 [Tabrizicola sp.]
MRVESEPMLPGQDGDWRKYTFKILAVVLICGLVLRLADIKLFDGLYLLLGIEKMPWQQ